jgi:hypothetical protein
MRYAAVAQAGSAFEAPGRHTRLKLAEHRGLAPLGYAVLPGESEQRCGRLPVG